MPRMIFHDWSQVLGPPSQQAFPASPKDSVKVAPEGVLHCAPALGPDKGNKRSGTTSADQERHERFNGHLPVIRVNAILTFCRDLNLGGTEQPASDARIMGRAMVNVKPEIRRAIGRPRPPWLRATTESPSDPGTRSGPALSKQTAVVSSGHILLLNSARRLRA